MISFKHITFTILSVSIWFTPVTSELTEEQIACIETIKRYTHYNDTSNDFKNCNYRSNPLLNGQRTENILNLVKNSNFQANLQDPFLNLSNEDNKTDAIIGLREQYTARLMNIIKLHDHKPAESLPENPLKEFCCLIFFEDGKNPFIQEVVDNAVTTKISQYFQNMAPPGYIFFTPLQKK